MAFFLVGGVGAGVALDKYPEGRVFAFLLIVAAILSYEPLMVNLYGGTFGHHALNICVVHSKTQQNLSLPRALLRALLKQFLGLFSLGFMFVTEKAQSLHDLAVGSEVRIRNPRAAVPVDYFVPEQELPGKPLPSTTRRIVVIAFYNVVLLLLVSLLAAFSLSPACLDQDVCTNAELQYLNFITFAWLAVFAVLVSLGWKARLPGCRFRRPLP
jgi:hypothetical protein